MKIPPVIILLVVGCSLSQDVRSDAKPHSRNILCYFAGTRSTSLKQLDISPCSHLVYTNICVDQYSRVKFAQGLKNEIKNVVKKKNTAVKIMISVGSGCTNSSRLRSMVSSLTQLSNFTSSIKSLHQEGFIQGIEIDWQWPFDDGDKRDKIKMIRYARQIKLAVGSEDVRPRKPRQTSRNGSIEATVEWENLLSSEKDIDVTQKTFTVAVRLPTVPKNLVNGYEFKLLNKFADYYILSTDDLKGSNENTSFHHSRLMGVSDVNNADSLVDIATSLGVPADKIILRIPAFGKYFELEDESMNTPGSPVNGKQEYLTHQQVCHALSIGNWTIERDEDFTAPYSFSGKRWIALEDEISVKIKAKYVLLRELGGVALVSLDTDDIDDMCGKGRQALLMTIHGVFISLERRPRQVIVSSLEDDLLPLPTRQTRALLPVNAAQHLTLSPFRIVRIVDRAGRVLSTRENSETLFICSRQGYYRHPEDCSRFYRCVKFNQYENDYTIFEYQCPSGLIFDDRYEVCVWPSQATPCDGSSEIFPIPRNDYVCPGDGYFVDPENCRWFFACIDHIGDGTFTHYEFRCPFGLAFDEPNLRCNWPWLVPACGNSGNTGRRSKSLPSPRRQKDGHQDFASPTFSGIPSFESSRTSGNVVPTVESGTERNLRNGKTIRDQKFKAGVVKDSCSNCFSQVITITGEGRVNDNGIEVAKDSLEHLRIKPRPENSILLSEMIGDTDQLFNQNIVDPNADTLSQISSGGGLFGNFFTPIVAVPKTTETVRNPNANIFSPVPRQGRVFGNNFSPPISVPQRNHNAGSSGQLPRGGKLLSNTGGNIETATPSSNGIFVSTDGKYGLVVTPSSHHGIPSTHTGNISPALSTLPPPYQPSYGVSTFSYPAHSPTTETYRSIQATPSTASPYNPTKTPYHPSSSAYNPPTSAYNPSTSVYNPPTSTYNPSTSAYNPPTSTYNPPTSAHSPSTSSYQPAYGVSTYSYPSFSTTKAPPLQRVTNAYSPSTSFNAYNPVNGDVKPAPLPYNAAYDIAIDQPSYVTSTPSYQIVKYSKTPTPPTVPYVPARSSYNPSGSAVLPHSLPYNPPSEPYQPQDDSYSNPGGTYNPPIGSYNPPQPSYKPPVDLYEPPDVPYRASNVPYNPPVKSYRPGGPPLSSYKPDSGSYNSPGASPNPFSQMNITRRGKKLNTPFKFHINTNAFQPQISSHLPPINPFNAKNIQVKTSHNAPFLAFNGDINVGVKKAGNNIIRNGKKQDLRNQNRPINDYNDYEDYEEYHDYNDYHSSGETNVNIRNGKRLGSQNQDRGNDYSDYEDYTNFENKDSQLSNIRQRKMQKELVKTNNKFTGVSRQPKKQGLGTIGRPINDYDNYDEYNEYNEYDDYDYGNIPGTDKKDAFNMNRQTNKNNNDGSNSFKNGQSNNGRTNERGSNVRQGKEQELRNRDRPDKNTNSFRDLGKLNRPFTNIRQGQATLAKNNNAHSMSFKNGKAKSKFNIKVGNQQRQSNIARPINDYEEYDEYNDYNDYDNGNIPRPTFEKVLQRDSINNGRPASGNNNGGTNSLKNAIGNGSNNRQGKKQKLPNSDRPNKNGKNGNANIHKTNIRKNKIHELRNREKLIDDYEDYNSFESVNIPHTNTRNGKNQNIRNRNRPSDEFNDYEDYTDFNSFKNKKSSIHVTNIRKGKKQETIFEAQNKDDNKQELVTTIKRPHINTPAILQKFGTFKWQKFGPGGLRDFNDTLGPEICERPGLFRHPSDCHKFYECYWDRWIEKFTLHIFPCPVSMAIRQYDDSISACNWPFFGPRCEG